jgi:hypothetical protein
LALSKNITANSVALNSEGGLDEKMFGKFALDAAKATATLGFPQASQNISVALTAPKRRGTSAPVVHLTARIKRICWLNVPGAAWTFGYSLATAPSCTTKAYHENLKRKKIKRERVTKQIK